MSVAMYEVFSISGHYVLHNDERSLWCSRLDGGLVPSNSSALDESLDPVCLGMCHGIVGKIKFLPESPENLVLISEVSFVCRLHGGDVYRIDEVSMLPLSLETPELELPLCTKHTKPPKGDDVTDSDAKIERKLEEEFCKWFEGSFYFSTQTDITHNLAELSSPDYDKALPLWQRVEMNYFWNYLMLQDIINTHPMFPDLCNPWILPIMQGFIEKACINLTSPSLAMLSQSTLTPSDIVNTAELYVISRRNKHRAGTRFKRRGIDELGDVANFVQTEQILVVGETELSYVLLRGSVPIFWYQPLTNYRPKPVLLKTSEESKEAFTIHMDKLLESYKRIIVVNLLDAEGKEGPLGEEYANIAYKYDHSDLTYVAFDFNEFCAGMKFDNVSILLKRLDSLSQEFSWTSISQGVMAGEQQGAIRVNCMDSLDRTNVVQGSLARQALINQAAVLNIPMSDLTEAAKLLWANNGDAISTQYAGTAALKGDYTRTGERGVAGMMKDGVSSVTRMYINVFRDTNRQAAIDIMQGLDPDLTDIKDDKSEELENVPELIAQASAMMLNMTDGMGEVQRTWPAQEWPSGEACAILLSPTVIHVLFDPDSRQNPEPVKVLINTCDRLQIGQPAGTVGHYLRLVNGAKCSVTLRPLTPHTNELQDSLMKLAHAIVSCRDDLGLSTQVTQGPLSKELLDKTYHETIGKIKSSANSFGSKIANSLRGGSPKITGASEKSSPERSPSPKLGNKIMNKASNMFRSKEEVPVPPVTLSSLTHRGSLSLSATDLSSPSLEEIVPQQQYLTSRQQECQPREESPPPTQFQRSPTLLQRCNNNRSSDSDIPHSRRSSSVSECSEVSDASLRGYHSDTEIVSAGETGFKERSKTFHTLDDNRSRSKFIFLL